MADKRKLQGEIDRCLKKVSEGVEQFDDIWQKVHNAANANQKEKYEADLKKEIKKLQRLRDQIKTWLTSNDIKDKRPLSDNRKLIETQMERFKVVERETKTKAYSKEGLGLAAKVDPAQKEKEEARAWLTDSIDALNRQIEQFESEIESAIAGTKKKRLDKERQERADELQTWVERHRYHVSKLETVMRMLDNCSLETDKVKDLQDNLAYYIDENQEPDFIEDDGIYDELDLDDTIMGQPMLASPSHMNNMEDEWEASLTKGAGSPVNSFPLSPTTKGPLKYEEERKKSVKVDGILNDVHASPRKKLSSSSSMPQTPPTPTQLPRPANKPVLNNQTVKSPTIVTANKQLATSPGVVANFNSRQTFSGIASQSAMSPPPVEVKPVVVSQSMTSYSAAASSSQITAAMQQRVKEKEKPTVPSVPMNSVDNERTTLSPVPNLLASECDDSQLSPEAAPTVSTDSTVSSASLSQDSGMTDLSQSNFMPVAMTTSILTSMASQPLTTAVSQLEVSTRLESLMRTTAQTTRSGSPLLSSYATVSSTALLPVTSADELALSGGLEERAVHVQGAQQPAAGQPPELISKPLTTLKSMAAEAVAAAGLDERVPTSSLIPSLVERGLLSSAGHSVVTASVPIQQSTLVQPLEPILGVAPLGRVQLTKDRKHQQSMLDASFMHLPLAADSERVRTYLSRNAYPTPGHHQQQPPPHFSSFEMFQRLSPETLFFIFYYQEGTRAQYLAAKALKKQSWRFHTKYMMWFQRYEDPKTITDEYEQGTYIYFDYEKWQQRRKEGFTFEYRYLEDKDLP